MKPDIYISYNRKRLTLQIPNCQVIYTDLSVPIKNMMGRGWELFFFLTTKMYRLLKTRHLVQLLTAFYSYEVTSNIKQFQPGLAG